MRREVRRMIAGLSGALALVAAGGLAAGERATAPSAVASPAGSRTPAIASLLAC